jgi:hypothetical protein
MMIIQAYPRLPDQIPYWLNLAGQGVIKAARSPLFFLYPLGQTLFIIGFWLAGRIWVRKPEKPEGIPVLREPENRKKAALAERRPDAIKQPEAERQQLINPEILSALRNLRKELVLLLLIFFNLIFIHIQRSLIWLAHGLSVGVNKFYFIFLFIIIFLLLPYYRFRRSLIIRLAGK